MHAPRRPLLSMLVMAGCALACARAAPPAGADKPVLEVDSLVIYLDEFQRYLQDTLGEADEGEEPQQTPESDPATASRLFDQFVEEQLLLARAHSQGVQVSDAEVKVYLETQGLPETEADGSDPAHAAATERFHARVRSTLLVQRFKDKFILKDVRVTPDEIEAFFREHPAEFQGFSSVVLRQILVDEEPLAKRIRSELGQGASFQELAERHSLAPDKGDSRQYAEGDLPEDLQAAIAGLAEGQISEVVNSGGRFHIFRLEARHGKSLQALDDVRERIEFKLLRRKMDETMARYLADLRAETSPRIYYENLPFTYQPESAS